MAAQCTLLDRWMAISSEKNEHFRTVVVRIKKSRARLTQDMRFYTVEQLSTEFLPKMSKCRKLLFTSCQLFQIHSAHGSTMYTVSLKIGPDLTELLPQMSALLF